MSVSCSPTKRSMLGLVRLRGAHAIASAVTEHPNIAVLVADVAEPEDAGRTVDKAVDTWVRIDALINNAGAGAILPLVMRQPNGS